MMADAVRVNVQRVQRQTTTLEEDVVRAEFIARLMDSQFEVGGVKFGLDALVGLIPVAGDLITMSIGLYPIFIARKHKLGRMIIARMLMNLGVDFVAGAVPVVGDALDVMVKANIKNVELLKKAAANWRLG